jgi:hypothetical protein
MLFPVSAARTGNGTAEQGFFHENNTGWLFLLIFRPPSGNAAHLTTFFTGEAKKQ